MGAVRLSAGYQSAHEVYTDASDVASVIWLHSTPQAISIGHGALTSTANAAPLYFWIFGNATNDLVFAIVDPMAPASSHSSSAWANDRLSVGTAR